MKNKIILAAGILILIALILIIWYPFLSILLGFLISFFGLIAIINKWSLGNYRFGPILFATGFIILIASGISNNVQDPLSEQTVSMEQEDGNPEDQSDHSSSSQINSVSDIDPNHPDDTLNEYESSTQETEPTSDPEPKTTQITPSGGLGDPLEVFERNYGVNSGNSRFARFQNDYILPMFVDGKAFNVDLQFKESVGRRLTEDEAMIAVKNFIPKDSIKIKEFVESDSVTIQKKIIYKSESLANAFEEKDLFSDVAPGTFTVVLNKDIYEPNYFSALITLFSSED